MNQLLLQTFLLLLASYFIGAFLACLVKRAVAGMNTAEPARVPIGAVVEPSIPPPVTFAPPPVRSRLPPPVRPPATPRPIDPVQPRIDVLRRPEPRKLPKLVDPGRFERALMGPDPNEGIPRKAIAEIRPKVLKSPTGPVRPRAPAPVVQPETPPPPPIAEAGIAAAAEMRAATPSPSSVSVPSIAKTNTDAAPPRRLLSDATTSAAAAAVAAAKAAAAASIGVFSRSTSTEAKPAPDNVPEKVADADPAPAPDPTPAAASDTKASAETSPEIKTPTEIKPAEKAAAVAKPPIEGGDDLQRIRAIDAEAEQKLKGLGVNYFEHIATWTSSDIKRIGQALGIPGRIDREQWVEQAQILAKGGETYYSRNRLAALKANTPAPQVETEKKSAEQPQDTTTSSDETTASATQRQGRPARRNRRSSGVAAVSQGRSVAEMASAAAAAIAAASASVTRGLKPIEPISPLSKVDPKISIPARLSDAIREKDGGVRCGNGRHRQPDH